MSGTSLFSDVTLQSDLLTQTTRHTAAGRNSATRPVVFLILVSFADKGAALVM